MTRKMEKLMCIFQDRNKYVSWDMKLRPRHTHQDTHNEAYLYIAQSITMTGRLRTFVNAYQVGRQFTSSRKHVRWNPVTTCYRQGSVNSEQLKLTHLCSSSLCYIQIQRYNKSREGKQIWIVNVSNSIIYVPLCRWATHPLYHELRWRRN